MTVRGAQRPHRLHKAGLRLFVPRQAWVARELVHHAAQRVSLLHKLTHVRQAVRVQSATHFRNRVGVLLVSLLVSLAVGLLLGQHLLPLFLPAQFRPPRVVAKPKLPAASGRTRFRASLLLLGKVNYLCFIDGGVREASLVGALVQNHRVFHVVARVGDDGNHGVGALGVVVHLKLRVPTRLHQRRLRGLNLVRFVVRVLVDAVGRGAHGLLPHLALVHDAGALVVVAEGRQARNQAQHVGRVALQVRARALLVFLLGAHIHGQASHFQVHLLQRPNQLDFLRLQMQHRAHHPRGASEQVQPRVRPHRSRGRRRHPRHFQRWVHRQPLLFAAPAAVLGVVAVLVAAAAAAVPAAAVTADVAAGGGGGQGGRLFFFSSRVRRFKCRGLGSV
mmetsp:Transcript_75416/g.147656  ORF Transcript_75416/g.147656 Transcript_75416/m.147656 type:complete len:390 (-) Transcript_75416:20-1189(-)